MFVNTNKPLHVSVLFIRPSSGGHITVLCAVTIMSFADLLSLSIYLVCGRMCISSICVCVCACACVLGTLVSGTTCTVRQ